MKTLFCSVLVLVLISPALAKEKQKAEEDPVVWGVLDRNSGCVIFKESRKTTGKFFGVAIETKTFGVLDVIETKNYEMTQKKWTEDQQNMNELQRLAVKDMVKFVKIQENYSPNLLAKARASCGETSAPDKRNDDR